MKLLFCTKCLDIRSFEAKKWTTCKCGNMAARWADELTGTVEVLAQNKSAVRFIGLHNKVLAATILTDIVSNDAWQELHDVATNAPGYVFDKSRRNCWAAVLRMAETSDINFHPDQILIDKNEKTLQALIQ